MTKQITRVWSFASDSNPNIEYQTLRYADGTTSCNCKGWTRRITADGTRSCKHTERKGVAITRFVLGVALSSDSWLTAAMPRKLRVQYPGAIYHVMSRGDRSERIYLDDVDRQSRF